ncbi:MAG: hypothetical protein ABI890_06960 [Lapillicoccus sp.]
MVVTITATFGAQADANHSGRLDAGDTIAVLYALAVTGPDPVTDVRISDPGVAEAACPAATVLTPGGAPVTCTVQHVITQGELDAGVVGSRAMLTGTSAGAPVTATAAPVSQSLDAPASLTASQTSRLTHDAHRIGVAEPGDAITYTVVVTNTGAVTLTTLAVVDPLLQAAKVGITCPPATLLPGRSATCTSGALTLTAHDASVGGVTNTATATAVSARGVAVRSPLTTVRTAVTAVVVTTKPPTTPPTKPAKPVVVRPVRVAIPVERIVRRLSIQQYRASVTDVGNDGKLGTGDSLTFGFLIVNTGTVSISGITVVDARLVRLGVPVFCVSTTLSPGAATRCVSGSVVITAAQAKSANGFGTNFAYATGRDRSGVAVRSNGSQFAQGVTVTDARETYLAQTGLELDRPLGTAGGLLVGGAILVLVGRGRRRSQGDVIE